MIDKSCMYPFTVAEDPGFVYLMTDQATIDGADDPDIKNMAWTPTQAQLDSGQVPVWAENDPPAVYLRDLTNKAKLGIVFAMVLAPLKQGEVADVFEARSLKKVEAVPAEGKVAAKGAAKGK